MFDVLAENLQNVFTSLRGKAVITEENIEAAIREVKRALIGADVSLKAIKTFTTRVREKAIGEKVLKGIKPSEQFVKIVYDEMIELLGSKKSGLNLSSHLSPPASILVLGLQGSGKTTTCAKLANYLKKKSKNPLLVALDLKRPAAIEQLTILGNQINVPVFNSSRSSTLTPIVLAKKSIEYAKENNFDVLILDSAGRLQIDTEMMAELLLIDRTIQPQEKLLVIDSMIGQEAANIASAFNTQIGITGIMLTKLDGDAKGGAALSAFEETGKPIKLVGVGEKLDDLQEFHPDRIASRILGMGDVLTLVEKAEEKIKEEEREDLEKELLSDFNFETFLKAQNMFTKLGGFSSIFNMLGVGGMLNQFGVNLNKEMQEKMLSEGENKLKKFKPLIQSMTIKERRNPDLLNQSRKARIARGAGLKMQDADRLVSEFRKTKKMFDNIKPLMSMLKGQGIPSLDMLKGGQSSAPKKPHGGLSKGFKPKKNKPG